MNPFLQNVLRQEQERQKNCLNLIASENYVSNIVLKAVSNVFTNKYAEGYPHSRYYQGCENVDIVEEYAIKRLKEIYGAEAANVQPHSGSQANQAVYLALLKQQDTILAMSLSSGGHLSHGLVHNFSGKFYNFVHYEVNPTTNRIDYDQIHELAVKYRPKLIIAGASSYSQEINFEKISKICQKVNAFFMVDMAHIAGLVAARCHPSPIPYADVITSTTHKTLRGPRGGFILCREKFITRINRAVFPGIQGGPLEHTIFAKAVAFDECLTDSFTNYSRQTITNAKAMCEEFTKIGIDIISGITANHQFSINVKRHFCLTGKAAADRLARYRIYVNQNMIPFDTEKPFLASGIRIGTPAITTLGATENSAREIAKLIFEILNCKTNTVNQQLKDEAHRLIKQIRK